ncbi:septum site-determining protein MinC [Fructilactobacillus carniphilus]|uniref:Probable septum site-determining protein MinC n=1 Tax=Fructilactobacillus carniphilus TaxID=2940297 RepID=A0ABY5C090_9LACO|nr:septum site-determining protein MinC [Fructilactobacillus carniphilus]USS91258.1 cell division inhibitor [Fructilactobacillus carniphilus]
MKSVMLKGSQTGFQVTISDEADFQQAVQEFKKLMTQLATKNQNASEPQIEFTILSGNRALSADQKQRLRNIVNQAGNLVIKEFKADVMLNDEAYHLRDENRVTIIDQTIRNGQDLRVKGDVLFLGSIHQGGRLITNGNLFSMGKVKGIVHVGFPVDESKLAIGDFHEAQQVRIGEQIEIIADQRQPVSTDVRTVMHVNDLHSIDYSNLDNIKAISPKFFSRIGGI